MAIESYQIFNGFPDFMPMFNPNQMLDHGIHEGVALAPDRGIRFKEMGKLKEFADQGLVKGLHISKYQAEMPMLSNNAYKVLEEIPPFKVTPLIDSLSWLEWYIRFYYGERTSWDTHYMSWWEKVVLWAFSKDAPKTHNVDQMLLHYSWNPGWEPKVIKGYESR